MGFLSVTNLSYHEPESKRKKNVKLKKELSEALYQVKQDHVARGTASRVFIYETCFSFKCVLFFSTVSLSSGHHPLPPGLLQHPFTAPPYFWPTQKSSFLPGFPSRIWTKRKLLSTERHFMSEFSVYTSCINFPRHLFPMCNTRLSEPVSETLNSTHLNSTHLLSTGLWCTMRNLLLIIKF